MPYGYITWSQLVAALLQRLQDSYDTYTTSSGAGFVTPTEAQVYLTEALRTLNAQCSTWNTDYVLNFDPTHQWQNISQLSGSPRLRTVTDNEIYIAMQYHLLEPPSGGTWTGTTQFNITDFSQALQYRRDELLQLSAANVVRFLQSAPVAGYRTTLPDTILQLRRVVWVPATGLGYTNYPLYREDRVTSNAYGPQDLADASVPESYMVTANAPLQFDCIGVPVVPAQWDIIALESGPALAPPANTVLGLPNDWCWLAKWGAMADCLNNSPERVDQLRAKYCQSRYDAGVKAMIKAPWLLDVNIGGVVVSDTPSVQEADTYSQNWETLQSTDDPQAVVGGMDLIALAPFVTSGSVSVDMTVVGNAPVDPAQDVQLSRDGVEAVLAYAQHLAMFKCGGAEFSATMPLFDQFEAYCAANNSRSRALGISRQELISEGDRGEDFDPRMEAVSA